MAIVLLLGAVCGNLTAFAFASAMMSHEIEHDKRPTLAWAEAAHSDPSAPPHAHPDDDESPPPIDHQLLHDVGHQLSVTLCEDGGALALPEPEHSVVIPPVGCRPSVTGDGPFRPPRASR